MAKDAGQRDHAQHNAQDGPKVGFRVTIGIGLEGKVSCTAQGEESRSEGGLLGLVCLSARCQAALERSTDDWEGLPNPWRLHHGRDQFWLLLLLWLLPHG